jgi:hypothetical protein
MRIVVFLFALALPVVTPAFSRETSYKADPEYCAPDYCDRLAEQGRIPDYRPELKGRCERAQQRRRAFGMCSK